MKQNQNPDDIFYLLEHADDETIRHLSENYLSADADEMERIFQRSEQKYEMRCQKDSDMDEVSVPVQEKNIRNSGLYRSIFTMAACLILTVGAVTGIMKLKPLTPEEELPSADTPDTTESVPETESETIQTTEIRQPEISAETTYVTDMTETLTTTAITTTVMTETTPKSTAVTSHTKTAGITETSAPETVQTVTETIIQTVPEETNVPEIAETIPVTETVPEITETETIPETTEPKTEPETETAQAPDSVFYLESKDYGAESGFEYIITSVKVHPDADAPDSFDVYYMPTWIPEGDEFTGIGKAEDGSSISYSYAKGNARNIIIHQYLQSDFTGLAPDLNVPDTEYSDFTYTTINQNPACYYTWITTPLPVYNTDPYQSNIIYWKQGGYILWLEAYNLSLEESFQIAESCVPTALPEEN